MHQKQLSWQLDRLAVDQIWAEEQVEAELAQLQQDSFGLCQRGRPPLPVERRPSSLV